MSGKTCRAWPGQRYEEAGNAGLRPATGNAGLRPATGNAGLRPATGNAGPRPATGNAGLRPATGNAGLRPATSYVCEDERMKHDTVSYSYAMNLSAWTKR